MLMLQQEEDEDADFEDIFGAIEGDDGLDEHEKLQETYKLQSIFNAPAQVTTRYFCSVFSFIC